MKVIIVLGFSFLLVAIEGWLDGKVSVSGLLAVVAMACVIKRKSPEFVSKRLSEKSKRNAARQKSLGTPSLLKLRKVASIILFPKATKPKTRKVPQSMKIRRKTIRKPPQNKNCVSRSTEKVLFLLSRKRYVRCHINIL